MGIFRRKRPERVRYSPPEPEPLDPRLHETAELELHRVEDRDEEIEQNRAALLKIRRENALGPRFWAAVGGGQ